MRLTVLGNNGPFPAAGGACSGYLLAEGDTRVLIDCGNGVLANLQKFVKLEELDAIILTHLHSDHMSDMMVLRYAIQIKMNRNQFPGPIDVYAPQEPEDEYSRLNLDNIFNLKPVTESLEIKIGNLKINFAEMTHPVKCYAVSFDNGSKRFVFSGDTSWNQNIIEFSKASDMVMLDAGLLSKDKTAPNVAHLTAAECGKIAREAGAKRLLLTHFWPEYGKEAMLAEAKAEFPGAELAELLCTYEL